MQDAISIISGKPLLKINKEYRELKTHGTVVIGNLFKQSLLERNNLNKKTSKDKKETLEYLTGVREFETQVYHCHGSDEKIYLTKNYRNLKNYTLFNGLFYSKTIIEGEIKKIICLSGFYGETSDLYHFNDQDLQDITKKETWTDLLCINSLIRNNITTFSPSFYELVFKIKPELIVIGNNNKLEVVKFPLTDIQTVLIGKNDHIIWDYSTNSIYRKL